MSELEWDNLQSLAFRLSDSSVGPGGVLENEWVAIDRALNLLIRLENWEDIIKLREMFSFLISGETTGGMQVVMKLNSASITAAEKLKKTACWRNTFMIVQRTIIGEVIIWNLSETLNALPYFIVKKMRLVNHLRAIIFLHLPTAHWENESALLRFLKMF